MERQALDDCENERLYVEESRSQIHEPDNDWLFKSVPEEESQKWRLEKERYDEMIDYIHQVDEILNLIKPFPRDEGFEKPAETPSCLTEIPQKRYGLDHLETILKLVEQLKELQENNSKFCERTCYIKDLKKLREHKKRLKDEEQQYRRRVRIRSSGTPENTEFCPANRKSSSTSEKFVTEPKETWQNKRKSICLGENRSKVSKWTKVKEAFHWEKTSLASKIKKENLSEEKENPGLESMDQSPDNGSSTFLDVFPLPPPLPPPPPSPSSMPLRLPRSEDLLTVRPMQTSPSSSSSDRVDEFFTDVKESKSKELDSPNYQFDSEEFEVPYMLIRKSSCEEFGQNLQSKEELESARSGKSNKTTWGKVKDIIQTRKDSLQKKPKKRGSDEFKKRRKLSTVSDPHFSDQFEDLSSPEEKMKNLEVIPRTSYDFSEDTVNGEEKCTKKSAPALTVTLPSTEELRSISIEDLDKKEMMEEDKSNILSQLSCQAQYFEDKTKCGKVKSGSNQRLSRWIKVKNVFLTSTSPTRPPSYLPVSSSPTTQNKSSGFFFDMESDDFSSGEWIDDKFSPQEKQKTGFPEPMAIIQEDIRKSYNELQKKLSQEFDQKLREWEMKCEATTKQEDISSKLKGDESDNIPKFRTTRDSITVPLPSMNDLSPEFKKKLNDWKKMKKSQSSSSVSSSTVKEEIQGQNIKIRIGEWQPWRTRYTNKAGAKGELEDYSRKSEEIPKGNLRKKKDDDGSSSDMNRRGSKKRNSLKKINYISGENLINAITIDRDGRSVKRSQKVKDFQWVEKELQKIEREKLRLEQEREKYLEREARLEKMKKTMGTTSPTQEILVKTPEGFFRFKGISQKFTKKLYEWEKARGIAPEASTFALLEKSAQTGYTEDEEIDSLIMQRSKSTGSVPELSTALLVQSLAHHPSSLSLNDVDEFKSRENNADESMSPGQKKNEPEAIIVDVEDVIEETALMADAPSFECETPVYSYASEDINRLMNNSGRFCFSSGIGIIDEKSNRKGRTVAVYNADTEKGYRDAKTRLDAETRILEKIREDILTNQSMAEVEGVKSHQAYEEVSSAHEFQKAEAEDVLELKIGKAHNDFAVAKVPLPISGKSSQRNYSRWLNESNRQLFIEKFEKNINQDFSQSDPEVLKRKMKMFSNSSWKYSEFDCKKTNELGFKQKEEQKNLKTEESRDMFQKNESVSVFVPTTRKIISPVKTTKGATPSVFSYVIDDVKPEAQERPINQSERHILMTKEPRLPNSKLTSPILQNKIETEGNVIRNKGIPPLPNSPKFQKKVNPKETAPSIRMIIAKYNQKISEHDNAEGKRNESGPPIWRSPVLGNRTQEKAEKFCIKRNENGKLNGEVQKSSSLGNMRITHDSSSTQLQEYEIKGILKSSSVGVMKIRPSDVTPRPITPDTMKENTPSMLRALKIQKAKEDFLSGRIPESSDTSTTSIIEHSCISESQAELKIECEEGLVKSVSAETITGENSHSDKTRSGRPLQKSSSKFDITNIKSKFRKIRMRKEKEPKLNAVAVLCRQSLFIEVPKASETCILSKSCPSSPVMNRSKQEKPKQLSRK